MMMMKKKKKNQEEEEHISIGQESRFQKRRSGGYSLGRLQDISLTLPPNPTTTSTITRVPSLHTRDMRRKRVRFTEPDTLPSPSYEPNTCSITAKGSHSPKFEDPKTSEYTFYKKLREDAGRNFQSRQLSQENRFKKAEASNHTGGGIPGRDCQGLTNTVKPNSELSSLSPIEKVAPVDIKSSHSSGVSRNPGPQSNHEDVFSIKRQNLLHLAAEVSCRDINERHAKGFDLVSTLLRRLVSESDTIASTSSIAPKSRSKCMERSTKSQLHVSSDIHIEELPETSSLTFISSFPVRDSENGLLEYPSNRSRACTLTQWANTDYDSLLTWHPDKIHVACDRTQSDTNYGERTSRLQTTRGSVLSAEQGEEFSFNRDGYLALDYVPVQSKRLCSNHKELLFYPESAEKYFSLNSKSSFTKFDEGYSLDESAVERGCCAQLTDWDTRSTENQHDLSVSSHQVLNFNPTWRTPFEEDWSSNCRYYPSSGDSHHCPDFTLQDIRSGPIPPLLLEHKPFQAEIIKAGEPDYLPMTIYRPVEEYRGLAESCSGSRDIKGLSIFHSPFSETRYTSKVLREKVPPPWDDFLQSSGFSFDISCKDYMMNDSFGELFFSDDVDLQLSRT